jgi:ATP-dependent Zn protease
VVVEARDESSGSWFKLLVGFGPTLLLIAAFVLLARRAAASGGGGMFSLGRSRAKRYSEEQPKVTFDEHEIRKATGLDATPA